ncbi:tetratricopeptide repeat protein [Planctomycetota bacterium]
MRANALILNAIIVGLGHVFADRHFIGLLHFIAFAVFANGIILGSAIWQGPEAPLLFWFSLCGALVMWVYSMGSLLHVTFFFDQARLRREMEEHYLEAIKALFNKQYHKAREELHAVLHLDPRNLNTRLMIAITYREENEFKRAGKLLKECSKLDRDGSWKYEIQEALRNISNCKTRLQSEKIS